MTGIATYLIQAPEALQAGQAVLRHLGKAGEGSSTARAAPSSRAERLHVYRQFQHAVMEFVVNQQTVRSMVPSLNGGIWSMPVHFRRLRHLDVTLNQLVFAITDLRLVGNENVILASRPVTELLSDLASVEAPRRASDLERVRAAMRPLVESVGEALSTFISVAREDLGHDHWRNHFWQFWRARRAGGTQTSLSGSVGILPREQAEAELAKVTTG